jgi:hypothetical protein
MKFNGTVVQTPYSVLLPDDLQPYGKTRAAGGDEVVAHHQANHIVL